MLRGFVLGERKKLSVHEIRVRAQLIVEAHEVAIGVRNARMSRLQCEEQRACSEERLPVPPALHILRQES